MNVVTDLWGQSVVVFSRNYLPLSRVHLKRAVMLLVTGKAEPLTDYTGNCWEIRSTRHSYQIPDHIRLLTPNPERVWRVPPVNRKEVLKRDKHQCQYCGNRNQLTLDHVIPKSKGGKHSWDNVVIACESCNSYKSDRTPQQAGMTLKTPPKAPIHPTVTFAEQFWLSQQM